MVTLLKKSISWVVFLCLFATPTFADITPVNLNISVSGRQRDTEVTFLGYTSPNALVSFQEDGTLIGNVSANSSGGFNKSFTARNPGTHSYGIFSEDDHSHLTPTYGFILNLAQNTETFISNVLLPTTIDVQTGASVVVQGSSVPSSLITIFVHSNPIVGGATAGDNGDWAFSPGILEPGTHSAYAQTSLPGGLQAISSRTVNFEVNCKIADLNCDGKVDMVDFSILMYYWGTSNAAADINGDHIVDLTDFSIMMFYWEG